MIKNLFKLSLDVITSIMKSSIMEQKMGDTKIVLNITVIRIFIIRKSTIQWKIGKDERIVSRFTIYLNLVNCFRVSMTPNINRRTNQNTEFDDIPEIPPRPKSAISNHSYREFGDFSKYV